MNSQEQNLNEPIGSRIKENNSQNNNAPSSEYETTVVNPYHDAMFGSHVSTILYVSIGLISSGERAI
jgi:hypothetical protein